MHLFNNIIGLQLFTNMQLFKNMVVCTQAGLFAQLLRDALCMYLYIITKGKPEVIIGASQRSLHC